MLNEMRRELQEYYAAHAHRIYGKKSFNPFQEEMDNIAAAHPEASALELKTLQYEFIAERFTPVIFRNTPFFSEMGIRISEYDGVGSGPGAWLMFRNAHLWQDQAPELYARHQQTSAAGFHISSGPFVDPDHHCFPFTAVLRKGFGYFYREYSKNSDLFSQMVCRSLLAVRKIAEKFAAAAEQLTPENDQQQLNLQRIAAAARRVPWEAPANFYEGLCTLWFLHEVCGSIDGIGMSVLGRPDYQLIALYQKDIADGTLSREQAYDLICRFMAHTDCKLSLDRPLSAQFNHGEQGDTLILGGCDENGKDCCNELTRLFFKAHRELKLIYPKLHFRYSAGTAPEFMEEACEDFLNGRNTVSFLNDDLLIPALIKAGKRPEDARSYVAGGCWEVIVEGCEHSQGANCYFNLARVLDISIHNDPATEAATGMKFRKPDGAADFEEFYQTIMANIKDMLFALCERIRIGSRIWSEVNPSPFFSAALKDCLANRRDYSDGGARYNPHGMPLANLAVLVDSFSAIREICFEKKLCTLAEYLQAIRNNWQDCELLRQAALAAPRFGKADSCTRIADRILQDIILLLKHYNDEHREIRFQPGFYNYRDIIDWSELTGATPDGRRRGDFLAQGLTPQRYSRSLDAAGILRAIRALPLDEFPANSTLTLTLQRRGMSAGKLAAVIKSFSGGMLQLNCLDKAELLDAVEHPEKHRELIVRLYGYSARFVSLDGKMQQEFISRSIL